MQWKDVSVLRDSQFQRLTGVKRNVSNNMLDAVVQYRQSRPTQRGRPPTVSLENQLLIILMYYREYRSFLHISITYNISEAQCWRIVRKMESILPDSKIFHLPGKKKLLENSMDWEVVVIDVGESPIERPKKTTKILFGKKETTHFKDSNCRRQG